MLGLLQKARLYLNLTPGERALLKLAEGLLVSAGLAGLTAVLPVLSSQSLAAVNWMAVLSVFLAAAGKTLWDALAKYFKAFGDPPLPNAADDEPTLSLAPAAATNVVIPPGNLGGVVPGK